MIVQSVGGWDVECNLDLSTTPSTLAVLLHHKEAREVAGFDVSTLCHLLCRCPNLIVQFRHLDSGPGILTTVCIMSRTWLTDSKTLLTKVASLIENVVA